MDEHLMSAMQMLNVQKGKFYLIKELLSGYRMKTRLLSMGLTIGTIFKVIHFNDRGPMLIHVRGTQLALGRGIVSKITVEETTQPQSFLMKKQLQE